jgi:hypothetical protein
MEVPFSLMYMVILVKLRCYGRTKKMAMNLDQCPRTDVVDSPQLVRRENTHRYSPALTSLTDQPSAAGSPCLLLTLVCQPAPTIRPGIPTKIQSSQSCAKTETKQNRRRKMLMLMTHSSRSLSTKTRSSRHPPPNRRSRKLRASWRTRL